VARFPRRLKIAPEIGLGFEGECRTYIEVGFEHGIDILVQDEDTAKGKKSRPNNLNCNY
jgi:hypothetical protein